MEVRFEIPDMELVELLGMEGLTEEFRQKVVIPFNEVFKELKNEGGFSCFEMESWVYKYVNESVPVIAIGKLREIKSRSSSPSYFFAFYSDGTARITNNSSGKITNTTKGTFGDILGYVFLLIKEYIADRVLFSKELAKVEAAMKLLVS